MVEHRDTMAPETGYLHDRVADYVRGLIEDGALQPGDRVPSLRGIARRFGVSMATAMRAYATLEDAGWIAARPKSGYFVEASRLHRLERPTSGLPSGQPERLDLRGLTRALISHDGQAEDAVTLSLALPPDDLLPARALRRAAQRAQRADPLAALRYTFSPGLEALRRQIAARTAHAGARTHPDDVLITTGCSEALHVALSTIARPGDTIAVESPTFFKILSLIESLGMRALELPTDAREGISVDALAQVFRDGRASAALLIPNFSNPLGSQMPTANRKRVAALAARYQVPVIEDDIYGELHFGPEHPPLLRAFDDDGWILTASSFSKTIAPGYRVGWLLPGRFRAEAIFNLHASTLSTATLPQMAIAEFLAHGAYSRFLKRLRSAYRERTERMRWAVAQAFPANTRVSQPEGGFVLWVELPPGVDGIEVYQAALAAGIRVAPGTLFSTGNAYDGYLRLSCGMPWSDTLEQAITRLGGIVAGLSAALPNDIEPRISRT